MEWYLYAGCNILAAQYIPGHPAPKQRRYPGTEFPVQYPSYKHGGTLSHRRQRKYPYATRVGKRAIDASHPHIGRNIRIHISWKNKINELILKCGWNEET